MSQSKKRRLAIFLDGTWNKPEDNTNVWRTKLMLAREDGEGVPQLAYYDAGVGTRVDTADAIPGRAVVDLRDDVEAVEVGVGVAVQAAEDADLMVILDPVQLGGGVGMGMREGDERLAAFDAAITSMKEDGTLNELILEWFGEEAATW